MKYQVVSAAALAATMLTGTEASIKLIERVGTWVCDPDVSQDCSVLPSGSAPGQLGYLLAQGAYLALDGGKAVRNLVFNVAYSSTPAGPAKDAIGVAYGTWEALQEPNAQSALDYTDPIRLGGLTGGAACDNDTLSTDEGQPDETYSARYVAGRYSGICGQCYQTYGTTCSPTPEVPVGCEDMELADPLIMLPTTDTVFYYDCDDTHYTEYILPAADQGAEHLTCEDNEPGLADAGTYAIVRPVETCLYDYLRNAQAFSALSSTALGTVINGPPAPGPMGDCYVTYGTQITMAPVNSNNDTVQDLLTVFVGLAPTPGAPMMAAFNALEAAFEAVEEEILQCFISSSTILDAMNSVPRTQKYKYTTKEQGEVAAIVTYVDSSCEEISSTSLWNTDECQVSAGAGFIAHCAYNEETQQWAGTLEYWTNTDCDGASVATVVSSEGACRDNPLAGEDDKQLWRKKLSIVCDLDSTWEAPTEPPTEEESGAVSSTTSVLVLASAAALSFAYSMI